MRQCVNDRRIEASGHTPEIRRPVGGGADGRWAEEDALQSLYGRDGVFEAFAQAGGPPAHVLVDVSAVMAKNQAIGGSRTT
jgi:hypothetical protein